ncbi:Uncharacterised protein [Achromobacter sp. 2789STDY5608615]|nr:Uncharacterised protein [Achromobacter sp. 2789STDY5608615]
MPFRARFCPTVTAVVAEFGAPNVKSSWVPVDRFRFCANEIGLPGVPATRCAPLPSVTSVATEPEPPSEPPALTVTLRPPSVPFTSSVPPLTVVPPPTVLLPVSVRLAEPSLVSVPVLLPVVVMLPP